MKHMEQRVVEEDGQRRRETYWDDLLVRVEIWDGFSFRDPMDLLTAAVTVGEGNTP